MNSFRKLSLLLIFSVISVSGFGQDFIPSEPPIAVENQLFGYSIAVSDFYALITAPQKDIDDQQSVGSAFFYERTANGWRIEQEVTPSGIPSLSNFGISAKLSGNTALIGSLGSENGILMQESVFVYYHNDTSWVNTQVLRPSDSKIGSHFGYSIDMAMDDEVAVIGAYQADGVESKSGAAYIFAKKAGNWIQTAKLIAEDGESHDSFGYNVLVLNPDLVAVGAYNATGANERSGAVYIFEKDLEGNWSQVAKLFDPSGSSSDLFGYSLAVQVDVPIPVKATQSQFFGTLFIGAPGSNNEQGVQTGSVYFYNQENDDWVLATELTDENASANDHFGIAIAQNTVSGLFIGANRSGTENEGKIYGYDYRFLNSEIEAFDFTGNSNASSNQYYGSRIATSSLADIIVSSPYNAVDGKENVGSVQFYNTPITPNEDEPLGEIIEYKLDQNYPNPFNPSTTINYQVKEAGLVKLTVFNLLGQVVQTLVNEQKVNGAYSATFDASALSSGFYFYRLEVNDFSSTKRMMLIK